MCLEVKYHCICGVVACTQLIACVAAIAHPHEESYQLQLYDMSLPREEWAARAGLCPQVGCPQNDVSTADADQHAEVCKCPGCSTLVSQGQPVDLASNDAKFLDRALWDIHNCAVEFCPFNKVSMVQADENLVAIIQQMQEGPESDWTTEDDEQILDLSRNGADAELIAEIVGHELADVQIRLDYLSIFDEVIE